MTVSAVLASYHHSSTDQIACLFRWHRWPSLSHPAFSARSSRASVQLPRTSRGSSYSFRIAPTGEIPSLKLIETELSYSFLDIGPLSKGHALVIPKYHAVKMHELPDEYLADALPIAKKIAIAQGAENYNILQNNGRLAHQLVDHVHFHVIPKPNEEEGLGVGWPRQEPSQEELKQIYEELKGKL
ncbi:hypothetical protein AX16_002235 [Volvariella volvacea WC 439]|nr:hypothetical protein AX16_002235 [Volvariella volvacea WC 439]